MKSASLKKKSVRRKAAFLTDRKYQEEPEYAESIPSSRWHNIELDWNGKRRRFQMNVKDHPLCDNEVSLGHVYDVDDANDEWVEVDQSILEAARADQVLMLRLNEDLRALDGWLSGGERVGEASDEE